jgi:hypothetical protein
MTRSGVVFFENWMMNNRRGHCRNIAKNGAALARGGEDDPRKNTKSLGLRISFRVASCVLVDRLHAFRFPFSVS